LFFVPSDTAFSALMKEMLLAVQGERPEATDRRLLARGEGDRLGMRAIELRAA
jgi:hypothetical protein